MKGARLQLNQASTEMRNYALRRKQKKIHGTVLVGAADARCDDADDDAVMRVAAIRLLEFREGLLLDSDLVRALVDDRKVVTCSSAFLRMCVCVYVCGCVYVCVIHTRERERLRRTYAAGALWTGHLGVVMTGVSLGEVKDVKLRLSCTELAETLARETRANTRESI